ncbi:hypothetical protein CGRA01v4_12012 [Colletotrichum graminicola]|uniref:Syndecan domain-containing protein n=1 Tax=Colletotrichum graminicola (strain M1.001 / M2 / FGSC 10212) TaxID=645133 RepID=E3QBM0_COLGM|nr:uncharacterized protein GLRG_03503 [Colletotrichum graminicola M1.001]EFQ28359.1 hypothetical protein GLRG_03503 [Colletotrichum graminicola M1.001]WDK20725.1 hypothetical protein CGRA01v4_12012 [Colletotrichum graminicola]
MTRALLSFLLLFTLDSHVAQASPRSMNLRYAPVSPPKPTNAPSRNSTDALSEDLRRRQVTSRASSLCGYYDGDPTKSRTADPGYGCREDIDHGLWGFCPTTVLAATDCGLAGNCVDSHSCRFGCGKTGIKGLTTFTCAEEQFCSTVILAGSFEGGFSYIACGGKATVETLFKEPTVAAVPSITVTPEPSSSSRALPSEPTSEAVASTSSPAPSIIPNPVSEPSSTPTRSLTQSAPPAAGATSPASEAVGNEPSDDAPSNTGAIVGGVVGGVAMICITVVAAVYLLRRNKNSKEHRKTRTGRHLPWGRSSSEPPAYGLSEADQADQADTQVQSKIYAGWGPSEMHGSEPWRNPTAPAELPGPPPAELPGRGYR